VRFIWAGDLLVLKVLAFSWKSVCGYVLIELDARAVLKWSLLIECLL